MNDHDKKNKEHLILEAAEQEFLTKGYDGARTTSIAQAAGVTHTMLHYYFRTKEQLFERILDEKFRIMAQSVFVMSGDPSLPIVERISSGIEAHFDFVAANPKLPHFIINEIVSRPERYHVLQNRLSFVANNILGRLQYDIDQAAARGEIERVDAKMLLISIVSLNIFTFIAYPMMVSMMGDLMADCEKFLAARKAENIEIIMRRIKKN